MKRFIRIIKNAFSRSESEEEVYDEIVEEAENVEENYNETMPEDEQEEEKRLENEELERLREEIKGWTFDLMHVSGLNLDTKEKAELRINQQEEMLIIKTKKLEYEIPLESLVKVEHETFYENKEEIYENSGRKFKTALSGVIVGKTTGVIIGMNKDTAVKRNSRVKWGEITITYKKKGSGEQKILKFMNEKILDNYGMNVLFSSLLSEIIYEIVFLPTLLEKKSVNLAEEEDVENYLMYRNYILFKEYQKYIDYKIKEDVYIETLCRDDLSLYRGKNYIEDFEEMMREEKQKKLEDIEYLEKILEVVPQRVFEEIKNIVDSEVERIKSELIEEIIKLENENPMRTKGFKEIWYSKIRNIATNENNEKLSEILKTDSENKENADKKRQIFLDFYNNYIICENRYIEALNSLASVEERFSGIFEDFRKKIWNESREKQEIVERILEFEENMGKNLEMYKIALNEMKKLGISEITYEEALENERISLKKNLMNINEDEVFEREDADFESILQLLKVIEKEVARNWSDKRRGYFFGIVHEYEKIMEYFSRNLDEIENQKDEINELNNEIYTYLIEQITRS